MMRTQFCPEQAVNHAQYCLQ